MRKRFIGITLVICMMLSFASCSGLTSCGGLADGGDSEKADPNRKQLYVGNYDGGMGREWLNVLDNEFEKANPEYQVIVETKKEPFTGQNLITGIANNRQDIYFTTQVIYNEAVTKGLFADITDVVEEKFEDINGVKTSIEDKMEPTLQKYFKKENGKYYAIPFFTAVYGLVYDRDYFEENNLLNLRKYSSPYGYDGKEGTADDGLPATWNDMMLLVDKIMKNGDVPFTWSSLLYYRLALLRAIWANYEGYDNFALNYSFDGTHSSLGLITPETGYKLQQQNGKKAALKAAYDMISNENYYSNNAFIGSQGHTGAQQEFIGSIRPGNKRIAMMFEGGWWENEARGAFHDLAEDNENYDYGKRNFGVMPIPRFDGTGASADIPAQTSTRRNLYSDGDTSVFISANSPNIDIAKKFLQFTTTNSALRTCTKITGVVRPFEYDMTSEDLASMTYFGRNMWELYKDPNTDLSTSYPVSRQRQAHSSYFDKWDFYSDLSCGACTDPLLTFHNNRGKYTWQDYYDHSKDSYTESAWKSELADTFIKA